jgi:hypothetical protein
MRGVMRTRTQLLPAHGAVQVRLQLRHERGRIDVRGKPAEDLLAGDPAGGEEDVVHEGAAALEVHEDDGLGNVLREEAQVLLPRRELRARLLDLGDVVPDHVHAADGARLVEVGHRLHVQVPLAAVGERVAALVGRGFPAVEHLLRALGDPGGVLRAHDLGGRAADQVLQPRVALQREMAVREHHPPVAVEVGDGVGDVVGEEPQLGLAVAQPLLRGLHVVDVDAHAVIAVEGAVGAEDRHQADEVPAPRRVGGPHQALVVDGLAAKQLLLRRLEEAGGVLGAQDVGHRAPGQVLGLHPAQRLEHLVAEHVAEPGVDHGDGAGQVLEEEAQLRFLPLQRLAHAVVAVHVEHERVEALHRAVGGEVRHEVHAHVAAVAVVHRGEALVGALLALEGRVDLRPDHRHRLRVEHLVHAPPDGFRGVGDAPVQARLVREAEAALAIDVAHGHADVVEHELQALPLVLDLALAVGHRGLRILQLLHVDQHHQHAAGGVGLVAQREVVRAHPQARVRALDGAAVEDDGFAPERAAHLRAAIVRGAVAERLVGGAPEHVGRRDARMRDVGRVHVAVAQLRVEHARGQPQQVEARPQGGEPGLDRGTRHGRGIGHGPIFRPGDGKLPVRPSPRRRRPVSPVTFRPPYGQSP